MTSLLLTFTDVAGNTVQFACDRKEWEANRAMPISTFQVAESMGFKGDIRQWQELLLIGD